MRRKRDFTITRQIWTRKEVFLHRDRNRIPLACLHIFRVVPVKGQWELLAYFTAFFIFYQERPFSIFETVNQAIKQKHF